MGEGDADAVRAEGPVQGVRGGGEVCEEGDGGGEGGEFCEVDGGEAMVFEGSVVHMWTVSSCVDNRCPLVTLVRAEGDLRSQRVPLQPSPQLLRFKRADASPEAFAATPWRHRVPRHEQGMFFVFGRSGR